ncbi:MAG: hypothetical protein IID28_11330, partial [Planctomycetes bacterium]|nr:hypothetical protein [Planctomycetota bacterium]
MDANPWVSEPTDAATGSDDATQGDSLGDQINSAIGDFDAKLTRFHEELQQKRSELSDLESLIEETETLQAKAFKELLSKNKQIRKMLAPARTSKPKKTTRRPRKAKPAEPKPSDPAGDWVTWWARPTMFAQALADLKVPPDLFQGPDWSDPYSQDPTASARSETFLESIRMARAELRTKVPTLAFLQTQRLNLPEDSGKLFEHLKAGIDETREAATQLKESIRNGKFPLSAMGPVIDEARAALGIGEGGKSCLALATDRWLQDEKNWDTIVTWGGRILPVTLGVAAFFVPGGQFLWAVGAVVGAATAGYEWDKFGDLLQAAQTQRAGNRLVDVTEAEARSGQNWALFDAGMSAFDAFQLLHAGRN